MSYTKQLSLNIRTEKKNSRTICKNITRKTLPYRLSTKFRYKIFKYHMNQFARKRGRHRTE